MLVYSKKTYEFSFICKENQFEVVYIVEYGEGLDLDSSFEVQGDINQVKTIEEILLNNEERIAELLTEDFQLETINEEDLK